MSYSYLIFYNRYKLESDNASGDRDMIPIIGDFLNTVSQVIR